MSSTSTQAETIQQQMRQVRRELREGVEEIVENARVMTDWTHYVRTYPWVAVGAAAAVGYLLVPSRTPVIQPDVSSLLELAKHDKLVVKVDPSEPSKPGMLGMVAGMVTSTVLQGGMAILNQHLHQFIDNLAHPPGPSATAGNGAAASQPIRRTGETNA
jgi:hypothetical protein